MLVLASLTTLPLSDRARAAIGDLDNTPAYSIASVWEMAIKVGLGKFAMSRPLYPEFARLLQEPAMHQRASA